jgi:membrane protein
MEPVTGGTSLITMNPAQQMVQLVDRFQQRQPWLAFPVAVWKKFGDDQAGNLAALVAYYAFVSIFPLLLVFVTVLDIVLRDHPALRARLIDSALADYPVIGDQIKSNLHSYNKTGVALLIGIVLIFLGARGVANAMQNALNSVWEVPKAHRPGFPWSWLRSFGLVIVVGLGEIITAVLSSVVGGTGHVLPGFAVKVAATAVSLVLNIGMFWLAFRLATAKTVTWRDLRLGAIIGGCIWQILQLVGGYFIGHQLQHSSALYGTFGIVLGLVAWLYLQAEATLYAAEANVVRARRLWPRSLAPPPHTDEDVRAYRLYAQVEARDNKEAINVLLHDDPAGHSAESAAASQDEVPGAGREAVVQGEADRKAADRGRRRQPKGAEPGEPPVSAGETRREEPHDRDEQRKPAQG